MGEPFGAKQVGSGAMPFKRNPVNAEKICSLARFVAALPATAWGNAAELLLERTLDDSANRRATLPEAFIALEECLITATRVVRGLVVDTAAIAANLEKYGPFAATERVLMALVMAGADRQRCHERLREQSLKAWAALKAGRPNPLGELLAADPEFLRYIQPARLRELMMPRAYVGSAPRAPSPSPPKFGWRWLRSERRRCRHDDPSLSARTLPHHNRPARTRDNHRRRRTRSSPPP